MKIGICQFSQETNTFSSERFGFYDLCPNGWIMPCNLIDSFRNTGTYLGGAIKAAEEEGAEIIPIHSAVSTAGPLMTDECVKYVLDTICRDLEEKLWEMDGLFLAMHGGGAVNDKNDNLDLEAYTLRRIRKVVDDMLIMSSLDMHCNISPDMLKLSDGLFPIKNFPHTDLADASYLATKTLIRAIRGEVEPVMSWTSIPQIYPNTTTSTLVSPMKDFKERFEKFQQEHGYIDVSVCQGFSANDQYWSGASVLITADRPAGNESNELAAELWNVRKKFEPKRLTAHEAMDEAVSKRKTGYVIINESTDNPGSGCPGSGTHLLRELIKRNIPGSVFMHICDAEAANEAHKAKVGDKINISIGGKSDPVCGEPIVLEGAEVLNLSNGEIRYVSPMNYKMRSSLGLSARLRYGNVEIVVVSAKVQSHDDRSLLATGADIADYNLVCLKSAVHFRGYFQERADAIVTVETPGLRSTDLKSYQYQNIRRPIYPLDEINEFKPRYIIKKFRDANLIEEV